MLNKIIDILSEYTDVDKNKISLESKLVADLELSSLDIINIIVAFEDEFGIEIPEELISELESIKDISDYLEKTIR